MAADNGNITYSKGTGNFGNSQTADSGESKGLNSVQVISSMGSSQNRGQTIKGIGIGLTNDINENFNIPKNDNLERRSVEEMVSNMVIDDSQAREIKSVKYNGYTG